MTDPETDRPEMAGPANDALEAEAATEAAVHDTLEQAAGEAPSRSVNEAGDESGDAEKIDAETPAKLERLQKILAQAGIASRRHAEELIEQGRVQVNGTVVTALGTKADAGRDHIRVDGKLLQGAERQRYFVLNKPKGFVTTVSDPEGRPTVMQFFEKMRERLYPVGRLDYLSEGLLLVTNDGDLANKLTKAASGVEKTYLVKVSGQPTEEELERLRGGVAIDRGRLGSEQVHTAPARIRQVRRGDNPWYELVLIEGRNRELRKMFEEIGHHVEKIRRVGYGPLVLDLEPGKMRELELEEVEDLRRTAEGKQRLKKAKDMRRAKAMDAQLPTVAPKTGRVEKGGRGFQRAAGGEGRPFRPKSGFERPQRPERRGGEGFRPDARHDRPAREGYRRESPGGDRPAAGRPEWKKNVPSDRGPARFEDRPRETGPKQGWGQSRGQDRGRDRSQGWSPDRRETRPGPGGDRRAPGGQRRADAGRGFGAKPAWKKQGGDHPRTTGAGGADRGGAGRGFSGRGVSGPGRGASDRGGVPRLRIDEISPDRPETGRERSESRPKSRPAFDRPSGSRPGFGAKPSARPPFDGPRPDRPRFDRSGADRPGGGYKRGGGSASPRGREGGERSFAPRPAGKTGGWKPKANFGGPRSAESGERPRRSPGSGSRPGGSSRAGGYSGRPSGGAGRSSGPPPGGSRPGGSRPGGSRPSGSRPSGSRPGGTRSGGARPGGKKPGGAKPGGARHGNSKPGGKRGGGTGRKGRG
jgi:23S rRNA pseudouridine2605 synthase